jgi:hypothetical protein
MVSDCEEEEEEEEIRERLKRDWMGRGKEGS